MKRFCSQTVLIVLFSACAFPAFAQVLRGKVPIPNEQNQVEAVSLIKSVFEQDYRSAKSNEQKLALAKKTSSYSSPKEKRRIGVSFHRNTGISMGS